MDEIKVSVKVDERGVAGAFNKLEAKAKRLGQEMEKLFLPLEKALEGIVESGLKRAVEWMKQGAMESVALQQAVARAKESFGLLGQSVAMVVAPAVEELSLLFEAAVQKLAGAASWLGGLFGFSGMEQAEDSAGSVESSMKGAAASAKRMRRELAGFDRLDVLKTSGGSGGSGSGTKETVEAANAASRLLERMKAFGERLSAYIHKYYMPSIEAWGSAFTTLKEQAEKALERMGAALGALWSDTLAPLGRYLLTDFIPGIVNAFSTTFAPIFTDVLSVAIEEFALDFEFLCKGIARLVDDILIPVLEFIKGVAVDLLGGIAAAWDVYGQGILDSFVRFKEGLRELIVSLYENVILPVLTVIGEKVSWLWTEHLKPLWDNIVLLVLAIGECVMLFWENVIVPLLAWLVETFGPVVVAIVDMVATGFAQSFGAMCDLLNGFIEAARGVVEFLSGVFSGDWERAWKGAQTVVEGVWKGITAFIKGQVNSIIDLVNGLISGVVAGMNVVIGAINSISVDIPDWVPGFGGKTLGFSLRSLDAPQIPRLAHGAVIPPNREFLAVLGDQRAGRNIETPEALLRKIVREEGAGQDVHIRFTGSLAQLARVLEPQIEKEKSRRGAALVK